MHPIEREYRRQLGLPVADVEAEEPVRALNARVLPDERYTTIVRGEYADGRVVRYARMGGKAFLLPLHGPSVPIRFTRKHKE
jgi:hypothetical protein